MICPKCKNEIEDNSLKCSQCGTRIGALCKDCGAYNLITAKVCSNCKAQLLKFCTICGAANLPEAEKCRKCGAVFGNSVNSEYKSNDKLEYVIKSNSQQNVKLRLIEGIKDSNKKIITLSGDSGIGKNLVLKSAIEDLKNSKLIWLMGGCSQISQLSPFGYFQDLLLGFFNINNFCLDTLQLKKNSIKFFRDDFPNLSNEEVLCLLNLLYPDTYDIYENIYYNKARMFQIMKKVFLTIVEKTKIVFIIDKFEYIDGMSFDFIKELLKENLILERSKFIILSIDSKPGIGLIPISNLKSDNYLDLSISAFTRVQIQEFLKQYPEQSYSNEYISLVEKITKGVPANIEQMFLLREDIIRIKCKNIKCKNLEGVIEARLSILKKEDWKAYRSLVAMSILGVKFYPAILENFDNNDVQEFERILAKLINSGFISQISSLEFEFKTSEIWHIIVAIVKNDNIFDEILNTLYDLLNMYKHSSLALLGYILQKLNNEDSAFDIWTILMKQASFVGDIGLYIIAQKQALKLIENKTTEFYKKVKKNIYTRVGKLLEPIDHNSSFEYLQQAIMMIEDWEDSQHVELLGYIASCSMKAGNYCGVIECIDSVLNKMPDSMFFEKILVKSRLVAPLLKLGNYGQLINIVETELLPELEKVLTKGKDLYIIKMKDLFELWIGVYIDYAEALVFQGDSRAYDIIQMIYEILDKNNATDPNFICRANLMLALWNTIKGDIKSSEKILKDILREYSIDALDEIIVSRWNFIDILNKFFTKEYDILKTELFNVVAYANNVSDAFTKNVLKTLLAKILQANNQTKKALEILEEQVSYFAKEKVATGVLLSWYLIADLKLQTNCPQYALDVATKALDIAQSTNINNYYFIAMFNKLIGEIYIAKQDFDSAKVYLEKSIFIAKQFDLQYVLVRTYIQCARLYQELALPKSNSRGTYIKQALKMFQAAKNIPIVAEQLSLQKDIKSDLNILTSFCRLNGIVLRTKDTK